MKLTGREIIDEGIVNNYIEDGIQQQGIDLRIDKLFKLDGVGAVTISSGTVLPKSTEVHPLRYTGQGKFNGAIIGWMLAPGVYDIEFLEGIVIPNNRVGSLKTRSSLVRQGSYIKSGAFDAGFITEKGGAMLYVYRNIIIEKGARVCQLMVDESREVGNTYDGQFQGDKQRQ